ncbi:MAG: POT family MFS transporter [Chitinophagales bacterium]
MSNTTKSSKETMPNGIPYIIGNEFAERFSFYGMKAILVVFMTQYLMNSSGELDLMTESQAKKWYHLFVMLTYFLPIFGALLSDVFLGKYRTIIGLSVVYCLGHLALALDDTRLGLSIGLTLIAIGSGGIKPCVSAHVGDQFSSENKGLLDIVFKYFYLAINVGSVLSMLLIPVLLEKYGPHVAFGLPGLLMLIATILFWMGRKVFVSVKPVGLKAYMEVVLSDQGKKAILSLIPIYLFVAFFFSVFDQTGSALVFQAQHMDKGVNFFGFQFELLASQVQAANPFFVIVLIPIFAFYIYPFFNKTFFHLKGLHKITLGMLLCAISFAICAWLEIQIQAGGKPTILIQVFAYLILTAAEILVSITALEMAYTQAPNAMKSFIMSFYLLAIAFGNFITAMVNGFNEQADGSLYLEGADYYWFFVWITLGATIVLGIMSKYYRELEYVQTEDMIE